MKKSFFVLLFIFLSSVVFGQSAAFIDSILDKDEISAGEAAYLALSASRELQDTGNFQENGDNALNMAKQLGWRITAQIARQPVELGDFCLMIMMSLEMDGGLMFKASKGPRYAVREMEYLGIIKEKASQYRRVGGDEALQILLDALNHVELLSKQQEM